MKALFFKYRLLLVFLLSGLPESFAQTTVPFNSDRWTFTNKDYVITEYLGKPSVQLKNNTARLKEANFSNGIIEFDVAQAPGRGFTGVYFRMQDDQNAENFYIRPHQSGNPDATQYQPIYRDREAWQLYGGPGYNAPVTYVLNEWMHVKLIVGGGQTEVYIRDMDKPALFVPQLKRPLQAGDLAVYTFGEGVAHFANFSYTPVANPTFKSPAPAVAPTPAGTITHWQVSNTFPEKNLEKLVQLTPTQKTGLNWQSLVAEATGIVNLATGPIWTKEKNTTFVRLVIESDREQVKPLQFGFSDRARVFLNDQLLYSGHDEFMSRDYRFLGTVGYYDEVYLPLKKGRNELWVAVSENFGGWGMKAAIADQTGLKIQSPAK